MSSFWVAVLASAAVSAIISSCLTLLGQFLERRSRVGELLLTKALDLAAAKRETVMRVAEKNPYMTASIVDDAINAETYFRWLKSLLDSGKLPPDADKGRL